MKVIAPDQEAKDKYIAQLESLLEEFVRVTGLYINTPEFDDLKERWDKLKNCC